MEVSDSRFPSVPDPFDQSSGQPFTEGADSIIRNRPPLSAWVDIPIRKAPFPTAEGTFRFEVRGVPVNPGTQEGPHLLTFVGLRLKCECSPERTPMLSFIQPR
jgi:hypothetical protein